MKADIPMLKKWITALRSGQYAQATGKLRAKLGVEADGTVCEGFCCLGVVEDLYAQQGMGEWDAHRHFTYAGHVEDSILLMSIARQLFGNERDQTGVIWELEDRDGNPTSLATANDAGLTFPQIADLIEYFYLKPALKEQGQ